MSADRVEVRPAIVVEVREVRPPPDIWQTDLGGSGRGARVLEESSLDVSIKAVRLAAEIRDEERRPSVSERISHSHTHPGAGMVTEDPGARLVGHLLEGSVPEVVKEVIPGAVVDEIEVRP